MGQNSNYTIQKFEAARNQLNTAIKLWFEDEDPISIHTLTCAAYQILHDIHMNRGGSPLLFDSIFVKDDRRNQWNNAVKKHMNFFKHASRDPNGTITFDPSLTEPFILFAIITMEDLGAKHTSEETAFFHWCAIHNSEWLNEQGRAAFIDHLPVEQIAHLRRTVGKKDFYRMFHIVIRNVNNKK